MVNIWHFWIFWDNKKIKRNSFEENLCIMNFQVDKNEILYTFQWIWAIEHLLCICSVFNGMICFNFQNKIIQLKTKIIFKSITRQEFRSCQRVFSLSIADDITLLVINPYPFLSKHIIRHIGFQRNSNEEDKSEARRGSKSLLWTKERKKNVSRKAIIYQVWHKVNIIRLIATFSH